MAKHRVCPWWLGYLLASPVRRWLQDPEAILAPYVREGTTVLEPGPGMGFFTLPLARMVGPGGRVIAVDLQEKMLASLKRRLAKAGLLERVDIRLAQPESMGVSDLAGRVDLVLVLAVLHEMPSAAAFFRQAVEALKPGGRLVLAEPAGHVKEPAFAEELEAAQAAGFSVESRPEVRRSRAAVLRKNQRRLESRRAG